MNKIKILSVFCIVSFLLSCHISITFGDTVENEFRKTIDFREGGEISLKNINGNIDVRSWEREEIEIIALIKVKADRKDDAEYILDKVEITIDKTFSEVDIGVYYPGMRDRQNRKSGFWDIFFGERDPNVSVSFWLKVPKKSDLDMRSTNGKIDIYDIEGEVCSITTNSSINIQNISGDANARATNGNIVVSDIRGDIKANTTNGKVDVKKVFGNIDAQSTNGSIYSEIVEVYTLKEMHFKTTNGGITIYIPKDINVDFDARTTHGKIYTDFPILIQGEINKTHIAGKINKGGPLIYLKTTNGGIKILER